MSPRLRSSRPGAVARATAWRRQWRTIGAPRRNGEGRRGVGGAHGEPQREALREPRGQAMVELAVLLLPILLIVVAIVQFGLLFGANVTLTDAAREGARAATIYIYDLGSTRAANDLNRCTDTLAAARQAFGFMTANAPNFETTTPCAGAMASDGNGDGLNDRWVNGDMTMSICRSLATPTTSCPNSADSTSYCTLDAAPGCIVRVQLTYHSDIVVPLIGNLLSRDGSGRFVQTAVATMVIN